MKNPICPRLQDKMPENHTKLTIPKNCPVSHQAISEIGNLTRLTNLNLEGTQIVDCDLEKLYNLRQLQYLNIKHTSITTSAVESLKSKLPLTRIAHD